MDVRARDQWRAYVVANLRSRLGIAFLVVGGGAALWQFLVGHTTAGLAIIAIIALNSACVGAAIGAWLGARSKRRDS